MPLGQLDEIRRAQGLSRRACGTILDLRERLIELLAFWALWSKHHVLEWWFFRFSPA
jgi:hypothetical protein